MLGQERTINSYKVNLYYYQYQPPPLSDQDTQELSENMVCVCPPRAFADNANEHNSDAWLFSEAIEATDIISTKHAITDFCEVTHRASRRYYIMYHPNLVPTFDRVYTKCIGDKLAVISKT